MAAIILLSFSFFINILISDINPKFSGIAIYLFPLIAAPIFIYYILIQKKK